MKIFLSSLENAQMVGGRPCAEYFVEKGIKMKWNLMSYYYLNTKTAEFIRDNSEEVLIDSGAHSFQKGKHVDWVKYTEKYAEFIKAYDRPNVVGYFEMDVDNLLGYENVLELRKILHRVTDKVIPVWHKNRGIDGFKDMCHEYRGKIVSITGFKNEEIQDHQYMMFLKYAKENDCKMHCLGMTRRKILDTVPFDYVDSSSWVQKSIRGGIGNSRVSKDFSREKREVVFLENYKHGQKMQEHYYQKWRRICKD